jgi:uncharacterized protein (DUF433 family)
MANAITYPHVVKTGDQPARLERHPRVRVAQIVMDYLAYGWSADEIHRQHPDLALAAVHSAMAYYYDNQAEIDAEIKAELADVDRALAVEARSAVWLKLKAQGSDK